ncbi:MAG: hypothetical protein FJX72_17725, partial [Armatimonadetes bacterium]|nr:hypothetical protein [Armatimonadota bacterium]
SVVRGDLWSVPADKGGDAVRLTDSPAHDHDFVWSPDGAHIVFVSDRDGLFNVYDLDVQKRTVRKLAGGLGDASLPQWSPDGKSVAYLLSGAEGGLYVIGSDGAGAARRIAESHGNNRFEVGIGAFAWSPDGKWLAFTRRDTRNGSDVWVAPVAGGDAVNVTSYPGLNDNPRWSSDGKYLTFTSTRDRPIGQDLYAVELQRPATPGGPNADTDGDPRSATAPDLRHAERSEASASPWTSAAPDVKIDFPDIELRAKRLTTIGVVAYDLTPDGKQAAGVTSFGGGADHFMAPLSGGPVQRLTTTGDIAGAPRFGSVNDRYWCLVRGGAARSYQRAGPGWSSAPLGFEARLTLDRVAERDQVFAEFWRSVATGFYDPAMHGVDWSAVRRRYAALLDGVATAEEFGFFVLSPMAGELNASHIEVSPPSAGPEPDVADLGLLYDETHVGPGVRVKGFLRDGPNGATDPIVKPGEYILSIGGTDVTWSEPMWATLSGRADKETELLVNSKPSKDGARTVKMKPAAAGRIQDLQYEQEVREAREQVDKLSGGRAAYIRIRSMDGPSLRRMERELWGVAQAKAGLVLDIRANGGGSTHDAILAQLARSSYGYTQPRDGLRSSQPWRHWDKPTVLLVDENSASDSEILAMGFRHLKLGRIVGARTPGYVIGTYSATLQDGTSYRVPMWRWLAADGRDLENVGVAPDFAVERSGNDAVSDEQLQEAVRVLLKDIPRP